MSSPFVAEIRMFGFNFAPKGWAFCNGQLLPISQNTALFSLLGTFYGGDGKSTFALPDMQGNAPMMWGQGSGLSLHDEGEMSGYLQRMLKAAGQQAPEFHPILEVNPEHALVKQLSTEHADFGDWCHLLFDQAVLAEGGAREDPASFVKRTNALLLAR